MEMEKNDYDTAKQDHEYCLRCGRKLKNPVARNLGYGQICYRKSRTDLVEPLFEAKVKRRAFETR